MAKPKKNQERDIRKAEESAPEAAVPKAETYPEGYDPSLPESKQRWFRK